MQDILRTLNNTKYNSALEMLRNHDICKQLEQFEYEMIVTHAHVVEFFKDDVILQQGKPSQGIYIILDGHVNVETHLLIEGTAVIEEFGPGEFLGEIRFIEQSPCGTSIIAKSQVTCLFITRLFFNMLSLYYPHTRHKLLTAITNQVMRRISAMYTQIVHNISKLEMTKTTSLFEKIISSLTRPKNITVDTLDEYKNQITHLSFLTEFNEEERSALLNKIIIWDLPKHYELLSPNDKKASCYIILQGAVRTDFVNGNKVAKLSIIGPDIFFASVSTQDRQSALGISFLACEQTILLELPEHELDDLQKTLPELWGKLYFHICKSYVSLEKSVDKLYIRIRIEQYNR